MGGGGAGSQDIWVLPQLWERNGTADSWALCYLRGEVAKPGSTAGQWVAKTTGYWALSRHHKTVC